MKNFLPALACVCLLSGLCAPRLGAQIAPPEGQATPVAPEIPKYPDLRRPGERGYSIGVAVWTVNPKPLLTKGEASPSDYPGDLLLPGKPKYDQGFEFGIAAGLHNTLRLSYSIASGVGMVKAPGDTYDFYWGRHYVGGTLLDTSYKMRIAKLSFDYLTWPYPVKTSSFRLKTLWQLHYAGLKGGMDAPELATTDSAGNFLVDSSGNPLSYRAHGTRFAILPAVGLGVQEYLGDHLRLEANAAGFAIPHHARLWDADASVNLRFGPVEVRAGARAYQLRTSPRQESWIRTTMTGPFIGIRFYSD